MEYETAGDPMSDLKWTKKTTQKIADELATINIKISKSTVGKILKDFKFSLKTNIKRISNEANYLKRKKEKNETNNLNILRKYGIKCTASNNGCAI